MKRKMLLFLCTIIMVMCCAFGFAACGDDADGTNTGNGGTDTEQGGTQKPDDSQGEKPVHTHSLTPVDAEEATCTTDGNIAYYTCSGCDKWFYDEDGTEEVADKDDVVIGKAHKLTPVDAEEATCTTDGNVAYYTCSGCDKWFYDEDGKEEVADKDDVVIGKAHKLSPVDAEEATCTEDGNSAYYTCSGCDKWFSDEDGKKEITDKTSVVLSKTGHTLTFINGKRATCTFDGNVYYCICGDCDKWFSDSDAENEITDKTSVILNKLGEHNFVDDVCTKCYYHTPTEGLKYVEYDDYCEVTGIVVEEEFDEDGNSIAKPVIDLYIAEEYNGKPVTSVGGNAFRSCSYLGSVTLPYGMTTIGWGAFYDCLLLSSIKIPDTVTYIGDSAFSGCSNLKSFSVPLGVTAINNNMFYNCNGLESISLHTSVTSIGYGAFDSCRSLTSIFIPNGVTSIGEMAFSYCDNLESITLPASLTSIGNNVFGYDVSSAKIIYEGDIASWCGISGIASLNSLKNVYIGEQRLYAITTLTIPDGVTSIGENAFHGCGSLTTVTIPSSVVSIGGDVFGDCYSLQSVVINDGVKSIGEYAFYGCTILTSITIPDSVTSIGEFAFEGCNKLIQTENDIKYVDKWVVGRGDSVTEVTEITLREDTRGIAGTVFNGCSNLTDITIPDSVVAIGDWAFGWCSSLESITIPDSVKVIGHHVFNYCSVLKSINVNENNENYKSVDGNLYSKDGTLLIQYALGKTETSFIIPDGVTSIGVSAFEECDSLENITIPDSVTSIGTYALYSCSKLTSITFNGTKEQWYAIEKADSWNWGTGNYTIHCIDGDLSR